MQTVYLYECTFQSLGHNGYRHEFRENWYNIEGPGWYTDPEHAKPAYEKWRAAHVARCEAYDKRTHDVPSDTRLGVRKQLFLKLTVPEGGKEVYVMIRDKDTVVPKQ